jgi:hypothetical protein
MDERTRVLAQIHKEANDRYPMKGCRLERMQLKALKDRFIKKKMEEFGLVKVDNKVNS